MDYRYVDFSAVQHLQIVEEVAERIGSTLYAKNKERRLVARSIAQFLAQSAIRSAKSKKTTEILSWIALPVCLAIWGCVGWFQRAPSLSIKLPAVRWLKNPLRYQINPDLYHTPGELSGNNPVPVSVKTRYLRGADYIFLMRLFKVAYEIEKKFYFQWAYKVAKEIAWIRPLIERHPADYALVEDECNAAISVATLYAHRHGQYLYSVQHGDLFISTSIAFFEADRVYCWADFYIEMLKKLKASGDFRTYSNPNFTYDASDVPESLSDIGVFQPSDFTLLDAEEKRAFAHAIARLSQNHSVNVRPHPSYPHEYEAMRADYGDHVNLAEVARESAKQFIARHKIIIGTTSTALLESVMLGKQTVSVKGKYVEDVAAYHYGYHRPNCHLVASADIVVVAENLLDGL